jgi:hypothetical protein
MLGYGVSKMQKSNARVFLDVTVKFTAVVLLGCWVVLAVLIFNGV